jgi:hypothetical protein
MTLWVTQKAKGTPRAMAANGQMVAITEPACVPTAAKASVGEVVSCKSNIFLKFNFN